MVDFSDSMQGNITLPGKHNVSCLPAITTFYITLGRLTEEDPSHWSIVRPLTGVVLVHSTPS